MRMKMKHYLTLAMAIGAGSQLNAQLNIQSGATFFIQSGATVTVQGDVVSNDNIQGTGLLQMKGTAAQNLNMNGFTVPNLEIDNTSNVALTGAAKVSGTLTFTNGRLQLGANNFTLTSTGTSTGAGAGKFAQADGTGEFRKEISATGTYSLPVGEGANYNPVSLNLSAGTVGGGAYVGARCLTGAHPNRPVRSSDYLNTRWPVTYASITSPTLDATGTYVDPTEVTGVEADIRGISWTGAQWSLTGNGNNAASNTVTARIAAAGNELYGMNRFVLANMKAFLQGAYNTGTGLMNDNLRAGTNLIPLTDPYRSAPYSTNFTQVNNATAEVASSSIFNAANPLNSNVNDIVDWVFVELRDQSLAAGSRVLQTRSVFVQRDGDLVDVDGVSPVYFKNVDAGANYTLVVRHRNHLGLGTDPTTNLRTLNETTTTALTDFTSASTALFTNGVLTNAPFALSGAVRLLWGGNVNHNTTVRSAGPSNDKDFLLGTVLSGVASTVLNPVYERGDVNLNRNARFAGPSNDKDALLNFIGGSSATVITQHTLAN
jgi:hypothetical protein